MTSRWRIPLADLPTPCYQTMNSALAHDALLPSYAYLGFSKSFRCNHLLRFSANEANEKKPVKTMLEDEQRNH